MKKFAGKLALILALTMTAASMSACSASTGSGVAKYGDEEIPMGEAEYILRYTQWMNEGNYWELYTYFGYDNMWAMTGDDGSTTWADSVHDGVMTSILQTRVLMDHASEYGIDGLTDEQKAKVEESVDSMLENYPKFSEHVSSTRDEMVSYMEKNAIASLVIEAVKDAANVEATEDEYNEYKVEYIKVTAHEEEETEAAEEETEAAEEEAAEEEAAHLDGLELVNDLLKKAEDGTEFSDLAGESDHATSNTSYFMVTGETSTEIPYTASKDAKVGDINMVEDADNNCWYIVKRANDLDEEQSETKRESVINEKESAAFEEVYTEWAKAAKKFTVNETKWAECTITEKIYEVETEVAETEAVETEAAETEAAETEVAETEAESK